MTGLALLCGLLALMRIGLGQERGNGLDRSRGGGRGSGAARDRRDFAAVGSGIDQEMGEGARHHRHQAANENGADDLVPLQRIHAENPVEKPHPASRGGGM
jgi:hypothetical protein